MLCPTDQYSHLPNDWHWLLWVSKQHYGSNTPKEIKNHDNMVRKHNSICGWGCEHARCYSGPAVSTSASSISFFSLSHPSGFYQVPFHPLITARWTHYSVSSLQHADPEAWWKACPYSKVPVESFYGRYSLHSSWHWHLDTLQSVRTCTPTFSVFTQSEWYPCSNGATTFFCTNSRHHWWICTHSRHY